MMDGSSPSSLDESSNSNKLVIDEGQDSLVGQQGGTSGGGHTVGNCDLPADVPPSHGSTDEALTALECTLKQFHDHTKTDQSTMNRYKSQKSPEKRGYESDFLVSGNGENGSVKANNPDNSSNAALTSNNKDSEASKTVLTSLQKPGPITNQSLPQPANSTADKQPDRDPKRKIAQDWRSVGVHRCPVCKFSTDDQELLRNHTTTCTPPKQANGKGPVKFTFALGSFMCETCVLSWKNRAEFEEHVVCHVIDKPYICLTCKWNFDSRSLLEKHAKTEHPNGDSRCGLKGIKKSRKLITELETSKVLKIDGKLSVPQTPRNLVKPSVQTSTPISSQSSTCVISASTCQSGNTPSISTTGVDAVLLQTALTKTCVTSHSTITSTEGLVANSQQATVKKLDNESKTVPEEKNVSNDVIMPNVFESISKTESSVSLCGSHAVGTITTSSSVINPVSQISSFTDVPRTTALNNPPLFGILNPETSAIMPANIPNKIQKVMNNTNVPSNSSTGENIQTKSDQSKDSQSQPVKHHVVQFTNAQSQGTPTVTNSSMQSNKNPLNAPYQVKHFTEFTSAGPSTPTSGPVSLQPSQPLILIPVAQMVPPIQTQSVLIPASQGKIVSYPQIPQGQIQQPTATVYQRQSTASIRNETKQAIAPNKLILQPLLPKQQTVNQLTAIQQQVCLQPVLPPTVLQTVHANTTQSLVVPQHNYVQSKSLLTPESARLSDHKPKQTAPQQAIGPSDNTQKTAVPDVPIPVSSQRPEVPVSQSTVKEPETALSNYIPNVTIAEGNATNVSSFEKTNPVTRSEGAAQLTSQHNNATIPSMVNYLPAFENSASATVSICVPELHKTSESLATTNDKSVKKSERNDKKLLFRIKPKHGFVCEGCRKYTRDEYVFRKHAWDHCHEKPIACKYCSPEQIAAKDTLSCKLVNDIVCSLIKHSAMNEQRAKQKMLNETTVIDISDDEDEGNNKDTGTPGGTAVGDDDEQNSEMQLKISSTFSLTDMDDLVEKIVKEQCADDAKENNVNATSMNKNGGHDITTDKIHTANLPLDNTMEIVNENNHSEVHHNAEDKLSENLHKNDIKAIAKESAVKEKMDKNDERYKIEETTGSLPIKTTLDAKGTDFASLTGVAEISLAHTKDDSTSINQTFAMRSRDDNSAGDSSISTKKQSILKSLVTVASSSKEVKKPEAVAQNQTKGLMSAEEPVEQSEFASVVSSDCIALKSSRCKVSKNDTSSHNAVADDNTIVKNGFENEVLATQSYNSFYMCGYETCPFSCLSSQRYKEHLQANHLNEYHYICCHCGLKDYSEEAHVRHLFSHANTKVFLLYSCPVRLCKFRTNLIHMYEKHLHDHKEVDCTIKCVYCHKSFPTVDSLITHLKQNLLKFFNCPHCSFRFTQKHIVTKHIKLFHPDKLRIVTVTSQVACLEREVNFYVKPLAKRQAVEELDIPAILDEVQSTPTSTGTDSAEVVKTVNTTTESRKENECRKDIKGDQTKEKKEEMPRDKIPTAVPEAHKKVFTPVGPMSLQCPHCSYLSYNQSLYVQHISLHEGEPERDKRYVCNLCPKGLDNLNQFKKHMLNHIGRTEIKIFCCTSCSYSSNQKCHIMDHGTENHEGKGTYIVKKDVVISAEISCRFCDFKARQGEHVVLHEELVHRVKSSSVPKHIAPESLQPEEQTVKKQDDGESMKKKKYHCDYCNGRFKHKHDLKRHLEVEHTDIENKQFISYKCRYCNSYNSSMKDVIVEHIKKKHVGEQEKKILRKVEFVRSKVPDNAESNASSDTGNKSSTVANTDKSDSDISCKQTVQLPAGNIFKQPFKCPLCPFSNNLRLHVIKHIKSHPNLIPEMVPNKDGKEETSKKTARKSTGQKKLGTAPSANHRSLLIQDIPSESKLVNPFASLKGNVEHVKKDEDSAKDPYILGEHKLHKSLSACFIALENDVKFKCRICQQKIAKKFVLHRHILNHLGIVFFKCGYCDEGSIEKTLMFGHIQKEHMQKLISFHELSSTELQSELKEKIFSQNFTDSLSSSESNKNSDLVTGGSQKMDTFCAVEASVDTKKDAVLVSDTVSSKKNNLEERKCPLCKYIAYRKVLLAAHIQSHSDPDKQYSCSLCHYRGNKVTCIKHVYSKHGKKNARVLKDEEILPEAGTQGTAAKEICKADSGRERRHSGNSVSSSKEEPLRSAEKGKTLSGKKKSADMTKDNATVYDMKTIFKCKDCGLKLGSSSGMYKHFQSSSCKRPFYQCSLCSFQSPFKNAIGKHAKLRHVGKKFEVCNIPLKSKMKVMKARVKPDMYVNDASLVSELKTEASSNSGITDESEMPPLADQNTIMCQLCKLQKFENVARLQAHINSVHSGQMLYCQQCIYKSPIVKHMINHCTNLHMQKVAVYALEPKSRDTSSPEGKQAGDSEKKGTSAPKSSLTESKDDSKKFRCPECAYENTSITPLTNHLYTHFSYKPFVCKYCNTAVSAVSNIKRHIVNLHGNKPLKYSFKKNESVEKKVKKIIAKLRNDRDKETVVHSCSVCDYESVNKSDYDKHIAEKHVKANKKKLIFQENESGSSLPKKMKTSVHESSSSGIDSEADDNHPSPQKYQVSLDSQGGRQFSCGRCSYKSGKKKHLRKHMLTHGSRLYKCCFCNYTSKLCTNAYRHVETVHPGEPVRIWNKKTEEIMVKKSTSNTVSSLDNTTDLSTAGIEDKNPGRKGKGIQILKYYCSKCSWRSRGLYQFREHLACHPEFTWRSENVKMDSKLSCGYCTHVSQTESEFSEHIECHMGERPFQCAYCNYSVFEKAKILYHTRQLHPKRNEIVIDRRVRSKQTVNVTLVDFDPKLVLNRVSVNLKKKVKNVQESDDDDDVMPMKKKPKRILESDEEFEELCSFNKMIKSLNKSENLQESKKSVEKKGRDENTVLACRFNAQGKTIDQDCQGNIQLNARDSKDSKDVKPTVYTLPNSGNEYPTANAALLESINQTETGMEIDTKHKVTGHGDGFDSRLKETEQILYVATKVNVQAQNSPNTEHFDTSEYSQPLSSGSQGFEVGYSMSQAFELQEDNFADGFTSSVEEASKECKVSANTSPGNVEDKSMPECSPISSAGSFDPGSISECMPVSPSRNISKETLEYSPVSPAEISKTTPEYSPVSPAENICKETAEYSPVSPAGNISKTTPEYSPVSPAGNIGKVTAEYSPVSPAENVSTATPEYSPVSPAENNSSKLSPKYTLVSPTGTNACPVYSPISPAADRDDQLTPECGPVPPAANHVDKSTFEARRELPAGNTEHTFTSECSREASGSPRAVGQADHQTRTASESFECEETNKSTNDEEGQKTPADSAKQESFELDFDPKTSDMLPNTEVKMNDGVGDFSIGESTLSESRLLESKMDTPNKLTATDKESVAWEGLATYSPISEDEQHTDHENEHVQYSTNVEGHQGIQESKCLQADTERSLEEKDSSLSHTSKEPIQEMGKEKVCDASFTERNIFEDFNRSRCKEDTSSNFISQPNETRKNINNHRENVFENFNYGNEGMFRNNCAPKQAGDEDKDNIFEKFSSEKNILGTSTSNLCSNQYENVSSDSDLLDASLHNTAGKVKNLNGDTSEKLSCIDSLDSSKTHDTACNSRDEMQDNIFEKMSHANPSSSETTDFPGNAQKCTTKEIKEKEMDFDELMDALNKTVKENEAFAGANTVLDNNEN